MKKERVGGPKVCVVVFLYYGYRIKMVKRAMCKLSRYPTCVLSLYSISRNEGSLGSWLDSVLPEKAKSVLLLLLFFSFRLD